MAQAKCAAAVLVLCMLCGAGPANAQPQHGDAVRNACDATTFRIYFRPDATRLNGPARAVIAAAARNVATCPAPAVAFAGSARADDALLISREAAILTTLRARGVAAAPVDAPRASLISNVREPAPAYIQVSVAATPREALAAARRALLRQRPHRGDVPIS
jgi:hypothetical protein